MSGTKPKTKGKTNRAYPYNPAWEKETWAIGK